MLRVVPITFIAIAVCLLVYGLCVRKYDGYHDDTPHLNRPHPPLLDRVSYQTFDARQRVNPAVDAAARPLLSTIAEECQQPDVETHPSGQHSTSPQDQQQPNATIASANATNIFEQSHVTASDNASPRPSENEQPVKSTPDQHHLQSAAEPPEIVPERAVEHATAPEEKRSVTDTAVVDDPAALGDSASAIENQDAQHVRAANSHLIQPFQHTSNFVEVAAQSATDEAKLLRSAYANEQHTDVQHSQLPLHTQGEETDDKLESLELVVDSHSAMEDSSHVRSETQHDRTDQSERIITTQAQIIPEAVTKEESAPPTELPTEMDDAVVSAIDTSEAVENEATDIEQAQGIDSTLSDVHAQTEKGVCPETAPLVDPVGAMNASSGTIEKQDVEVENDPVCEANSKGESELDRSIDFVAGNDRELGTGGAAEDVFTQSHLRERVGDGDIKFGQNDEASTSPLGAGINVESSERSDGIEVLKDDVQQDGDDFVLDTHDAIFVDESVTSQVVAAEVDAAPEPEEQPDGLCPQDNSNTENQSVRTASSEEEHNVEIGTEELKSTTLVSVIQLDNDASETPAGEPLCLSETETKSENDNVAGVTQVTDPTQNDSQAETTGSEPSGLYAEFAEVKADESITTSTEDAVINILRHDSPAQVLEAPQAGEQEGNVDESVATVDGGTLTTCVTEDNDCETDATVVELESPVDTKSPLTAEGTIVSETTEVEGRLVPLTEPEHDAEENSVRDEIINDEMSRSIESPNGTDGKRARDGKMPGPNTQVESVNAPESPKATELPHEDILRIVDTAEGTVLTGTESTLGHSIVEASSATGACVSAHFGKNEDTRTIDLQQANARDVVESAVGLAATGIGTDEDDDMQEGVGLSGKSESSEGGGAGSSTRVDAASQVQEEVSLDAES
ncbi:hypothetical protein FGB62_45g154 [Gracilaria domingensis]|nr:hypothetical protein FGB62_45g154 [Gracilaria domingensis]